MPYLGLVIYRWGWQFQDHLLTSWLEPTVAELRRQRVVRTFWFDRFDARGPHLSIVLTLTEATVADVASLLSPSLSRYLAAFPSLESLSPDQVAVLHKACRGKMQCEIDRLSGLAENDTFVAFEHPPWDFPFSLSQDLAGKQELWDLVGDVTVRSIAELATERPAPIRAAVRWVAAMDNALERGGFDTTGYWRYHASTLLLPLQHRLASEEERVLTELPEWIGEANRKRFEPLFEETALANEAWPRLSRLVELAGSRWALLREIQHSTLKQLGLGVALHIPLILFAWHRSLTRITSVPQSC